MTRVVLIPGWNEGADGMQVFVDGRQGRQGLAALGFDCAVFNGGSGSLADRIEQLAQFLAGLRSADSSEVAVALFGYSAGGLIARGLLRAHPETSIAALFQLATPNAGIVTDDLGGLLRRIHFGRSVIEDLDIESPFIQWLNQTPGHWQRDAATHAKRWKLDKQPWVGPANVPVFSLAGRMPRYGNRSDGVVLVESATLDGHVPHDFINGSRANHLNLGGTWNPLTLLLRGWRRDDVIWPMGIACADRLFRPS
ncbi:MAG: hypothetical protein ABI231_09155 [Candidatus Tumulicola sp.]